MSLFRTAENETAYLKMGILGFQGAGKTYTAIEIAIGLIQKYKLDKGIAFLDTETGSDWAIPRCTKEGIPLIVAKTRAFTDLLTGIREAESNASVLIVDSVSHFWTEMIQAYKREKGIGVRMAFHHWSILKPEWHRFSEAYINSRLHFIVCGRAGWDWGHEEDEEGNKELRKLGTKMKVEGEFGFEPSILLEMERVKGDAIGASIVHRCTVIKDRRMDGEGLDGKSFENPKFADFLPHIECLNIGGVHIGVDGSRVSDAMFRTEGESYTSQCKRATVLVEEIDGELESHYPGVGKVEKIAKAGLKKHLLGTYSDTEIADMKPDDLKNALAGLREIFGAANWAKDVEDIVAGLIRATETEQKKGVTK